MKNKSSATTTTPMRKKPKLTVTIPKYNAMNDFGSNNNNINRKEVPNSIKRQCYEKGVSMYELGNNKVVKKNVSILRKHCANNKAHKDVVDENTKRYGVPPKPERVLAIMKTNSSKPSFKNAVKRANDPFYNFGNLRYFPTTPIPYSQKTWPKNHEVYSILPAYFPGTKNVPKKTKR
jgi:hypothetical protein